MVRARSFAPPEKRLRSGGLRVYLPGKVKMQHSSSDRLNNDNDPRQSGSLAAGCLPFRPHRWLRGGHVQTIAMFLLPRRVHLPPAEERLVEVAPGIKIRCWCHWGSDREDERRSAITLIVVHGLEGSTDSEYMLGVARNGLACGMNVVRMNQRNCGGMDECAATLYNSSLSADVATVAQHLIEHDGIFRFALIGFSMGGNLVLKLAGEWGSEGPTQFRAVASVCPSIDLAASADALHRPENRLYEYYFLWKLRRRLREKAKFFPRHFEVALGRGVRSLRAFDAQVTAYYCGFAGAEGYYQRPSASREGER